MYSYEYMAIHAGHAIRPATQATPFGCNVRNDYRLVMCYYMIKHWVALSPELNAEWSAYSGEQGQGRTPKFLRGERGPRQPATWAMPTGHAGYTVRLHCG